MNKLVRITNGKKNITITPAGFEILKRAGWYLVSEILAPIVKAKIQDIKENIAERREERKAEKEVVKPIVHATITPPVAPTPTPEPVNEKAKRGPKRKDKQAPAKD